MVSAGSDEVSSIETMDGIHRRLVTREVLAQRGNPTILGILGPV